MSFAFEEASGFSAFALFNGVKLHFTSNYDFFKYGGKTHITKENFMQNKSKYTFYRLSRKYSLDDLKNFYVSNFVEKDVNWVGEIANAEGEDVFKEWQKRTQRLTYQFEQDIIQLMDEGNNPEELLRVKSGQHPLLLIHSMQRKICIETLVIMNDILNFFPMWSKKIEDTIIWPSYQKKCEKYLPFLNYDKVKFKNILKESLKEYA
ncbi:MAG: hypothetical protein EBU90_28310 [Proteobacteria bacterium]|nr:hypothetical protein [Pseudomonadota bacterium]